MRAILIDPFTRTVSEVQTDANLDDLYNILNVDCITVVRVHPDHAMILDDEGLLKDKETQEYFFVSELDQPFAGKALILGDRYGENRDATLKVDTIKDMIVFANKENIDPDRWNTWTVTAF